MKYTDTAYKKAEVVLEQRRRSAEEEAERRTAEIQKEIPETAEIQKTIRGSYLELLKIIASHDSNAKEKAEAVRRNNLAAQKRMAILLQDAKNDKDYLKPKYSCSACSDTGYTSDGKMCVCYKNLLKQFTAEELNMHSTMVLCSFDEYNSEHYEEGAIRSRMDKYYNYFRKYCAVFPHGCRSMLFMGKTGLGKTFLSSCIARELTEERGFVVVFSSALDLFRQVENERFNGAKGNTLDTVLNADMVILDDLGSESPGAFYESVLYNIVNGRINLRRPTIISTNLDADGIGKRYNERITSRLLNEFMPFTFVGKDIRQQKSNMLYKRK